MLLSAVSILVVAQSSSEIPVGLMNNSVYSEQLTASFICILHRINVEVSKMPSVLHQSQSLAFRYFILKTIQELEIMLLRTVVRRN